VKPSAKLFAMLAIAAALLPWPGLAAKAATVPNEVEVIFYVEGGRLEAPVPVHVEGAYVNVQVFAEPFMTSRVSWEFPVFRPHGYVIVEDVVDHRITVAGESIWFYVRVQGDGTLTVSHARSSVVQREDIAAYLRWSASVGADGRATVEVRLFVQPSGQMPPPKA